MRYIIIRKLINLLIIPSCCRSKLALYTYRSYLSYNNQPLMHSNNSSINTEVRFHTKCSALLFYDAIILLLTSSFHIYSSHFPFHFSCSFFCALGIAVIMELRFTGGSECLSKRCLVFCFAWFACNIHCRLYLRVAGMPAILINTDVKYTPCISCSRLLVFWLRASYNLSGAGFGLVSY